MNVHSLYSVEIYCSWETILHDGSVVGWMMKESSINYWQGKVVSHLQSIQATSEASSDSYSLCTQGKVAGPGSKSLVCLVPELRVCGAVSALPPHSSIACLCGT